jgi:hypothetical protein
MYLSRAIFRSSALSIVNQLNIAFLLFSPFVYAAAQCEQPTMLKTVVNVILTCNNWWRWKSPCTTHTEQNGIHSLAKKS